MLSSSLDAASDKSPISLFSRGEHNPDDIMMLRHSFYLFFIVYEMLLSSKFCMNSVIQRLIMCCAEKP